MSKAKHLQIVNNQPASGELSAKEQRLAVLAEEIQTEIKHSIQEIYHVGLYLLQAQEILSASVDSTEEESWRDDSEATQSDSATSAWAEFQEFSVTVGEVFTVVEVQFSPAAFGATTHRFDFRGDIAKYGHDCKYVSAAVAQEYSTPQDYAQELATKLYEEWMKQYRKGKQTRLGLSRMPSIISSSDEYYTPKSLLEMVTRCIGPIDLDPCSNSHAMPNVAAYAHYTKEEDGLVQDWHKTVFLNPPYSKPEPWMRKLIGEYKAGNVDKAIALFQVHASADWFQLLLDYPICLISKHWKLIGNQSRSRFASALLYLGPDSDRFCEVFDGEIGVVVQRRTPTAPRQNQRH